MNLLQALWRMLVGATLISVDVIRRVYVRLVIVLLVTFGVVLLEWGLNVGGMKEMNYVFFFGLGLLILVIGFAPVSLGAGAAVGSLWAAFRDEDITQGATRGIEVLARAVIGILAGFMFASLTLAIWSFEENPGAFFPILAVILTASVFSASGVLNTRQRLRRIAAAAAALAIVWFGFTTIPPEYRIAMFGSALTPSQAVTERERALADLEEVLRNQEGVEDARWIREIERRVAEEGVGALTDEDRELLEKMRGKRLSPFSVIENAIEAISPDDSPPKAAVEEKIANGSRYDEITQGTVMAPTDHFVSVNVRLRHCIRYETDQPGADDLEVRYNSRDGRENIPYVGGFVDAWRFHFRSKLEEPVGVRYFLAAMESRACTESRRS